MKKSTFFTIVGVGIILIGAGAYVYIKRNTSEAFAKEIIKKGNTSAGVQKLVDGFTKGFLKAWAKASRNFDSYFMVDGKKYNTKGGSASTT